MTGLCLSLQNRLELPARRGMDALFGRLRACPLALSMVWLLSDIEESVAIFGRDWQPNGVEANLAMVQALADELFAEGLMAQPVDAAAVFAEFESAMKG